MPANGSVHAADIMSSTVPANSVSQNAIWGLVFIYRVRTLLRLLWPEPYGVFQLCIGPQQLGS